MRTSGKVHQSPGQIRITSQPGLKDGWIWRSSGVDRRSERVLERNAVFAQKMAGNSIATACKGKPRSAFFACLRAQGKKVYGGG
jgi:hypothetical protein